MLRIAQKICALLCAVAMAFSLTQISFAGEANSDSTPSECSETIRSAIQITDVIGTTDLTQNNTWLIFRD